MLYNYCIISVILAFVITGISAQATYSIPQVLQTDCATTEFFNTATFRCESCAANRTQSSTDSTICLCNPGFRMDINDPRSLTCIKCPSNEVVTSDGYYCTSCGSLTSVNSQCSCSTGNALAQYNEDGGNTGSSTCTTCNSLSIPSGYQRCVPCPECCATNKFGELCFTNTQAQTITGKNIAISDVQSEFLNTANVKAAYGACSLTDSVNQTACQQLANMCVMENYALTSGSTLNACGAFDDLYTVRASITDRIDWKDNLPWLKYTVSTNVLTDTGISTAFEFSGQQIQFLVAKFRTNGTYMGFSDVTNGLLQLCKDTPVKMNAAYVFGTSYQSNCNFDANILWEDDEESSNVFFELYLKDGNNLYPIPVQIVGRSTEYVRRFYLIDNIRGRNIVGITESVYYAKSMSLLIKLQLNSNPGGKIYPPLLTVEYAAVQRSILDITNPTVVASFAVSYEISMENFEEFLKISLPLIGSLAILLSFIETSGWRRRQGIQVLDFSSLMQLLLSLCANLGNAFFAVMFVYSTVILIFFKKQTAATFYVPTKEQELFFIVFTSLAVAFKTIQILGMIMQQCSIDMFLLDWEKPSARGSKEQGKVSVWRTFFIANEWHEIETLRKTNPILQLFALVFFLKVIGFEELALMDHSSVLVRGDESYTPEYSAILRFSVGCFTFLCIAIVQMIYFLGIHERFFEDPIRQFVDLCSVANVSVFVLSHNQFGYYIHGRSVHGTADTDMVGMTKMLKREEENIVSRRGLIADNDNQTFDMQITPKMRLQFDKIYEPLNLVKNQPTARGGQSFKDLQATECAKAYNIMRNFLTSFLDHSLRDLDYIVKDKLFLEKVLNMEFREPFDRAYLNNDDTGCSFCDVLFYNHEAALLIFEILIFTITDYIAQDFVIAAIVTYIIYTILVKLRTLLSGYNITKKTLVDSRFLI